MKNINIIHHPFRGDFSVWLNESVSQKDVEPYFKIKNNRINIRGGLVSISDRGIRTQRLGQGVFLKPSQVRMIKVGWRKIWPENKFLRFIKNLIARMFSKRLKQ